MGREPSRAQSRRDCLSRKAFQRHTGRDGVSRNGLAAEARARQSETAIPAAYTRTFATLREVPEYSFGRFGRTFSALEARCPDFVPTDRWQLAVEDGRVFLARWGGPGRGAWLDGQGYLFGLHTPPAKPHPSYSRLSRYDEIGLIWLLCGRPVVALTAATAAIRSNTGAITIYRRFHST